MRTRPVSSLPASRALYAHGTRLAKCPGALDSFSEHAAILSGSNVRTA